MNVEDARAAIFARLHTYWNTAHPGVPVEYENQTTIDMATATAPFIAIDIVYNDAKQISMGRIKGKRRMGAVWLTAAQKEGSGTAVSNGYLAELETLFDMLTFSGVNTEASRRVPSVPHKGWYVSSLRVPFWFDDLTA